MSNANHDANANGQGSGNHGPPDKKAYHIRIDRAEFAVEQAELTGAQLRRLPSPPIGVDRDLFEVVPGGSDKKIADLDIVPMRDGLRFFTAPAQINPG